MDETITMSFRALIERYRTCETAAQVAEMQEQIISDGEAEYMESRRKGQSNLQTNVPHSLKLY